MKKNRLLVLAGCFALLLANIKWIIDVLRRGQDGQPFGADFIGTWSAAFLAYRGKAVHIYDLESIYAVHQLAVAGYDGLVPWHYPPVLLLLTAPIGGLSFGVALSLFTIAGFAITLLIGWRIKPKGMWFFALLSAPAFTNCLLQGQNGWLTAALAVGGLLMLSHRPLIAGSLMGELIYKPQFMPIFMLQLLYFRQWRALVASTATVIILILLSLLVFGLDPWIAFIHNASYASHLLTDGQEHLEKMGSAFSAAKLLGLDALGAWIIHGTVSALGLFLTLRIWQRTKNADYINAASLLAACLITPYQFDYDLLMLTAAVALWIRGKSGAYLQGEAVLLGALWLTPALTNAIAKEIHVQILPSLLLTALWMLGRLDQRHESDNHNARHNAVISE